MMRHPETLAMAAEIALAALAAGMLVTMVRLVKGPTLTDRVIALDVIASLGVAMLGVLAIRFDQSTLLQPAVVLALVAFLGTMAFAHYIEKRTML